MSFQEIVMSVSKRENKEFKELGKVTIYVPLLADIFPFVNSQIKKDEKGNNVVEDGIPVYEADEANWIQGAMFAMAKAQARNKLKIGTIDLKDNNKIATNWAELCAEGVRDGAGLAIAREARAAFGEWLAKQGLSEGAAATLNTLFNNRAALQLQTAAVKSKVEARVLAFGESLTEEQAERFTNPINAVLAACEASSAAEAMDF